jgi:DNA primase
MEQLKALGRLTKNIKICFDADEAGLRATERAIELSQNLGINLGMIELPGAKDPDELIKKGVEGWRRTIANAKPAVDYLFDRFASVYDLSTATGKRQYSDRLASNLKRLGDAVERDHYVKLLAEKIDASQDAIREKIAATQPAKSVEPRRAVVQNQPRNLVPPEPNQSKRLLEEALLAINLAYPEVRLSVDDITAAHFDSVDRQQILEALRGAGNAEAGSVADSLPNLADYVKILTLRGEEEYGSFAPADRSFEAFQLAGRLQTSSNKEIKAKLSRKLREAEAKGDAQLARMLLTEYQALMSEEE